MTGIEASDALIALFGDQARWTQDPVHLAKAVAGLDAARAAACGDDRALSRAAHSLLPTAGTPPLPATLDLPVVRASLAASPAGLPVHPAWRQPYVHWDAGALSVIAAPTSAGKTTMLVAQVAEWLRTGAGGDGRLLIFSCETPAPKLAAKVVGLLAGRSAWQVIHQERTGRLTSDVADAWAQLASWAGRLVIVDSDTDSLALADHARRLADQSGGLAAVVVDYIQELPAVPVDHPDADRFMRSREVEVGTVARRLRDIAIELQVPVVAAAQFNRTVNRAGDFVPDLLQLRESARIEQAASLVLGIRNSAMSGAAEAPASPPVGWAPAGNAAYQVFDRMTPLAAAAFGAQIRVRELHGPDAVLTECFILKNREYGHVWSVLPFAVDFATGQMSPLEGRYVPHAGIISDGKRRKGGGADRAFALFGDRVAQSDEEAGA